MGVRGMRRPSIDVLGPQRYGLLSAMFAVPIGAPSALRDLKPTAADQVLEGAKRGRAVLGERLRGAAADVRAGKAPALLAEMRLGAYAARAGLLAEQLEAAADEAAEKPPASDLIVSQRVRAISAVVVQGWWVDHTDPEHMKAAVPLFERIPIFANHCSSPDKWHGFVIDPTWDEAKLPPDDAPGVTVTCVIDGSPGGDCLRLMRGVQERSLTRWSLGFYSEVHPSHSDMEPWEFMDKLGQHDADGELVRFICDAITDIYELSSVDVGAVASARTLRATAFREASERLRRAGQAQRRATLKAVPAPAAATRRRARALAITDSRRAGASR